MADHQDAQQGSGSVASGTESPRSAKTGTLEIADVSSVDGSKAPSSNHRAHSRAASAPRSLVPSEYSQSGRSTEISEELLELLRRIHDRLFEDEDSKPAAGALENDDSRQVTELRWYENTHPGVDFLGKNLSEMRSYVVPLRANFIKQMPAFLSRSLEF
jgi:hypothetical protein